MTITTPHIAIIGSLNIDFATTTTRFPSPGETVTATSLTINAGGKGGNQALAAGRSSFTTKQTQNGLIRLIGAVGADCIYWPELMEPVFQSSAVVTKDVNLCPGVQTGAANIIVEESGENRILVVPGANHADVMNVEWILSRVMQTEVPQVVVLQGEIPRSTTLGLLEYFNERAQSPRPFVVFNPAPVFPDGILLESLMGTAVLIMNETEAMQMASCIGKLSVSSLHPEQFAQMFHELARVQIVVITLGAKGVFFSTKSGRVGFVDGVKVDAVRDTTAAGDTFVGFFGMAFTRFVASQEGAALEGFDEQIEEVVKVCNAAAATCVQREGAMKSIPFAYELD
ncbi:Ribokinase [Penicillium verhagenii]|nr:Ribokinase [Penicillium verhagenii]